MAVVASLHSARIPKVCFLAEFGGIFILSPISRRNLKLFFFYLRRHEQLSLHASAHREGFSSSFLNLEHPILDSFSGITR